MNRWLFIIFALFLFIFFNLFLINISPVLAIDSDGDGLKDEDEINIYFTNPNNIDTDSDGYSDGQELNNGYSPYNKEKKRLIESDYDHDGLTDDFELNYNLNSVLADTDKDGFNDKEELLAGYDPKDSSPNAKLEKYIEIDLLNQKLKQMVGRYKLNEFLISSGAKLTPTPKGEYKVINKSRRAWSRYGLWMPWWIGLGNGKFGIHELPEWPNGHKEGASHLGKPVSHGCIRLGIGPAKLIYDWSFVGMKVKIY